MNRISSSCINVRNLNWPILLIVPVSAPSRESYLGVRVALPGQQALAPSHWNSEREEFTDPTVQTLTDPTVGTLTDPNSLQTTTKSRKHVRRVRKKKSKSKSKSNVNQTIDEI